MSDLHFQARGDVGGQNPRTRLDAAIRMINRYHADADGCVITGDLVNDGDSDAYSALAKRLSGLKMPIFPIVGNHDDRALMRKNLQFPDAMPGFVQYTVDVPDARLIFLDSLIPGATAGELCQARLDWLRAEIAHMPELARYIFIHHPPCRLGLPAQDPDNLRNPEELFDLLESAPAVRQIFAGHVHRPCAAVVHGIGVQTIRSVTIQAPSPWPEWDWDSFVPADETPQIGLISIEAHEMRLQFLDVSAG